MRSIANYSSLLPLLEQRVPSLGGYPQRYAAALYLNGDGQKATEFIDSQVAALNGQNLSEVVDALEALRAMISKG